MPRLRCPPHTIDPFHLDPHTVSELMQLLDERLAAVKDYGGTCTTCGDAEAHAFLARLWGLCCQEVPPAHVSAPPPFCKLIDTPPARMRPNAPWRTAA
jgi:hypothetical protein